jgi:pentatricopeptide repeat protein
MAKTSQQEVFELLSEKGSLSAPMIAKMLGKGITPVSMTAMCQRMRKAGFINAHYVWGFTTTSQGKRGRFEIAIWSALDKDPPVSRVGKNSCLVKGRDTDKAYRMWVLMMKKRYGPTWEPKRAPDKTKVRYTPQFLRQPVSALCRALGY